MSLYDRYVAVDWSAANRPVAGTDSIWVAVRKRGKQASCKNVATRSDTIESIRQLIKSALVSHERLLIGFDFGFGYPEGFAVALTGEASWDAVWQRLARDVEDGDDNGSNRFQLGARYNAALPAPRFWGLPHQHKDRYPGLPPKKPAPSGINERRIVEGFVRSAQSVFQLAYNGAVGSQTLLGIARLQALREEFRDLFQIWPFETSFADDLDRAPVTIAEIYPTLFLPKHDGKGVKDAAQVTAVVDELEQRDVAGALGALLAPPPGASQDDVAIMVREEGSILGAGVL